VQGWSSLIGTTIDLKDSSLRTRLEAAVAEAITTFEPRLEAVRVRVPVDEASAGAEVRVEIRAMLKARHGGEPVAFETMIRSEKSRLLSVRRAVERAP
jgi:predicted component of type VI protein secretion system